MTKIGFYPGCSLKGTSAEYAQSTLALSKAFGIDAIEMKNWNCCGASAAHNLNDQIAICLPAKILALAEQEGLTEIVVPCAACYNRLTVAQYELNSNKNLKKDVFEILRMTPIRGNTNILNIIQYIEKYIVDKLKEKVAIPFKHKVVCYYGCLLVRPFHILKFDRLEDPQLIDNLMKKIGASPLGWSHKTECCGAGFSIPRTDIVAKLSGEIVQNAINSGAAAIIVACPMCHSNLDMRRQSIDNFLKKKTTIPILYVTQALGMACGLNKKEIGIHKHFVKVDLLKDKSFDKQEIIFPKKKETICQK